jgi:CRISPR type IV-associated protein Csf2
MTKPAAALSASPAEVKHTVILDGTLTALSPIAVSPPSDAKDKDRVQRLPTMPVISDGVAHTTAYLPASTIRGALRRAAVAVVIDLLAETGGPKLTPNDYLLLALGGVKDRKDEGAGADKGVDLQAVREFRRTNPLVSLFGAMAIDVGGNLRVGHGVPTVPFQPGHLGVGARHDPFARQPELLELFDADAAREFLDRNADRQEGNRLETQAEHAKRKLSQMKAKKKDDDSKALTAQIEQLQADAKAAFERAGGAVNIQQPLAGYEALPIGLEMRHRIVGDQLPPIELALLLAALERFARQPTLGGHAAHGCGEITGTWAVSVARRGAAAQAAGTITLANHQGLVVETDHPVLTAALALKDDLATQARGFDLGARD